MNFILKKALLIFILIGIISCNNENTMDKDYAITGRWELHQYFNQSTGVFTDAPEDADSIEITFRDKTFDGYTGRNTFFGNYFITSKALTLMEYGTTEVAESEWGMKFTDAIVSSYDSENEKFKMLYNIEDSTLKIEYHPNKFMVFDKKKILCN